MRDGTGCAGAVGVTLIELGTSIVISAFLGAGIGTLVGWAGSWPLLLSAAVGAASTLVVGAIALLTAIAIAEMSNQDEPPPG